MDPALRLLAATALVVVVGWAPFACSAVSPTTRDALVKTALDEARRQCSVNPPNDARLQAGCLALLEAEDDGRLDGGPLEGLVIKSDGAPGNAATRVERAVTPPATGAEEPGSTVVASPGPSSTSDAGVNVTPGNAVRNVGE